MTPGAHLGHVTTTRRLVEIHEPASKTIPEAILISLIVGAIILAVVFGIMALVRRRQRV